MVTGAKLGELADGMKATQERKPELERRGPKGAHIPRRFTRPGINPLDEVSYEKRTSRIVEPDGRVVFEVNDVEVPSSWSQLATDILASKYARRAGVPGTGHETSARQVVHRIAHTIRTFGEEHGYFKASGEAETFEADMRAAVEELEKKHAYERG